MEAARVLRAIRRRMGVSQRTLAEQVGCSARAVAGWEAGRNSPTAAHLDAALTAAGLDLALVPRQTEPAAAELVRYLHLSLTQRLRLALGESPVLVHSARTAVWDELVQLARRGQVVLEPPVATAMWLPMQAVPRLTVSVFHARTALASGHIQVRLRDGDAPAAAVPVPLDALAGTARVWVLPPAELAQPSPEQALLWQADQLLAAEAPTDDGGRRRPAHRDPDASDEDYRLLRTKSVTHRPDMRDGRAWRLGAPASLAQQLLKEMTG